MVPSYKDAVFGVEPLKRIVYVNPSQLWGSGAFGCSRILLLCVMVVRVARNNEKIHKTVCQKDSSTVRAVVVIFDRIEIQVRYRLLNKSGCSTVDMPTTVKLSARSSAPRKITVPSEHEGWPFGLPISMITTDTMISNGCKVLRVPHLIEFYCMTELESQVPSDAAGAGEGTRNFRPLKCVLTTFR